MNAVNFLPVFQFLLVFLASSTSCYPTNFYGSKRYGRSNLKAIYNPYDYYARSQRYPYDYYPTYTQLYPDEYYYNQESYPLYYIAPRSSKYEVYQPYYYQDVPVSRTKYGYYNYADLPLEDQERALQDIEREQRERSQTIGHEIRYQNDYNNEEGDETNSEFLNNLIMQQAYQDSLKDRAAPYYDRYLDYTTDEADAINFPTKWDDVPYDRPVEDQEVQELKELPKKQKSRKHNQRKQRKQKNVFSSNENPSKRSTDDDVVVYPDRKPLIKDVPPTETASESSKREARGQKEEVLMRPATPVRHPFTSSVLDMLNNPEEKKKRSPSVYDTIRQMLEMEKYNEDQSSRSNPEIRSSMKKRIVSSEDSLTRQLSVLKKAQ